VSTSILWIAASSVFAGWLGSYLTLASMAKPEYRHLFYSAQTGADFVCTIWEDAKTDEQKMVVFTYHTKKWRMVEGEVKAWTLENWARWKTEGEAWFTEEIVQRVPDDFIPVGELTALNAAANGGKRRRSSLGLVESVRRGSIKTPDQPEQQ
jgi:hypothetical protein